MVIVPTPARGNKGDISVIKEEDRYYSYAIAAPLSSRVVALVRRDILLWLGIGITNHHPGNHHPMRARGFPRQ